MKRKRIKVTLFALLFVSLSGMFISPRTIVVPSASPAALEDITEAAAGETPEKTPLPTALPTERPLPSAVPELEEESEGSAETEKKTAEVNEYASGVSEGTVRYVSQLNEVESNGWGKYAWKAGMECTTACISMSLSCIGVDASPEEILDYSSQTVLASTYGIDEITASDLTSIRLPAEDAFVRLEEMLERYESDMENTVSPPLLYFSGNGHYHAFIIIGEAEEENQYLTVDPTIAGVHSVSISEEGEITTEEEGYLERYTNSGEVPASINSIAQWQLKT